MKRKLFSLKNTRAEQIAAAESALKGGDTAAYEAAMTEVERLNGEIGRVEKLLDEQNRFSGGGSIPPAMPGDGGTDPVDPPCEKKKGGLHAMLKMLRGQRLDEKEAPLIQKALISGDNAVSGENYLVPEDVKTEIREMRRSYKSAKDFVNVVVTDSLAGSTNFESGSPSGLTDFDDGDDIPTENNPSFIQKKFAIGFRGKLIPISRVLGKLVSGLLSYLNRWFVRNAIISENQKIFAVLKDNYNGGVAKAIVGLAGLKKSINKDLDPDCLIDGVILTNQSGFDAMDQETDGMGRPMLQPNPADPTKKLFQGLPIEVFSDRQLPNIDTTHFPIFFGNTKAGCDFMEYESLLFEISEHFLFNKNQNCLRVIEGFDVVSTDNAAYVYGSFEAKPAE